MRLYSENEKMSWVLQKNPETQKTTNTPFSKSLRKGTAYGWFVNDNEFRMTFVDSPTESSFNTRGDYEYLDRTRYTSPYLPIAMITTLLNTAMKKDSEYDIGAPCYFECLVELSAFNIAHRLAKMFNTQIEIHEISRKNHLIKFHGTRIKNLLNTVISFLIVQAIGDENIYVPIDDGSIMKYIDALNTIRAPYYPRYMLSMKAIRSPNLFESTREHLSDGRFKMNFGDTQNHRFTAISNVLQGHHTLKLVDVGCGEMYYSRRLCKTYGKVVAYDADTLLQDSNRIKNEHRKIENIEVKYAFGPDDAKEIDVDSDVLMTEVIEHMPKDVADTLLNSILEQKFNKFIVTAPNKEFNVFYGLADDEFRHPDHHYEPTSEEFYTWMNALAKKHGKKVEILEIGDSVILPHRNVSATLGVIFKEKE